MKMHLIWIPAMLIATASLMQPRMTSVFTTAKPVEKQISFSVYKANAYNAAIYNNTSARVQIRVEKVSGDKRTIVWQEELDARQLSQFPSVQEAMTQTVKIPNVNNKHDRIEVSYTLTYDSQGSTLQMQGGTVLAGCTDADQLKITI